MAIRPWKRFFGLQESRWAGRDPDRRPLPDDCNTVVTPSALREAGVTNVPRGRLRLERDPRFHHYVVDFPDGSKGRATHQTSLAWFVGVQSDEGHERSRANLLVGRQVLETIVTQQGSGAPFVPEVWRVPVAPPPLRTGGPLPEARQRSSLERPRRQADHPVAVARNDRELYYDIESHLRGEVLRILTAAEAAIGRDDIAAKLQPQPSGEEGRALATALHRLMDEGVIIREGFLYHVAL
jgi:hypothetical protein